MVDDSADDVRLTADALKEANLDTVLTVAPDAETALAMLERPQGHAARRPHLILLDLHLPRRSGLDVLAHVKADPTLRSIPVVMFSASSAAGDVDRAYALHANCYVTKPRDFEEYVRAMTAIEDFWSSVASLPAGPS
jgi:CheY-like chemotaxis protein